MPAAGDLASAVGLERATTPADSLRIAPGRVTVETDAVERIEAVVRDRPEVATVVVIGGERGLGAVRDALEAAIRSAGADVAYRPFEGQCSVEAVVRHREALDDPDLVVGVGGGKALDTAKLVAEGRCPVVTVPTSAATSAAWAALSVVYDDSDGRYRGGVPFARCPDALLLDPTVIAKAPARYLANGIMDASAKFFETRLIERSGLGPLGALGRTVAESVYADPLQRYARTAVADARAGEATPALAAASEAAIAGPGVAAGLLSDRTYLTLPHVLCYTLLSYGTVQRDSYHGERVAYGVLVLQALLGQDPADLRALAAWYESLGERLTLRNLGAESVGVPTLGAAVHEGLEHNILPQTTTAEAVTDAIRRVESLDRVAD